MAILDSRGNPIEQPQWLEPGKGKKVSTNLDDIEVKRYEQIKKLFSDDYSGGLVKATEKMMTNFRASFEILQKISGEDAEKMYQIYSKIANQKNIENMKESELLALHKEMDKLMQEILKKKEKMGNLTVDEAEAVKKQKELVDRMGREMDDGEKKRGGGRGAVSDVLRGAGQMPGMGMLGELGGMMSGGFTIGTIMGVIASLMKAFDGMVQDSREFRRALAMPGGGAGQMNMLDIQRILTSTERTAKEITPDITKGAINQFLESFKGTGAAQILPTIYGAPMVQALKGFGELKEEKYQGFSAEEITRASTETTVLKTLLTVSAGLPSVAEQIQLKDVLKARVSQDKEVVAYADELGKSLGKLIGTMAQMQNVLGLTSEQQTRFLMEMDRLYQDRILVEDKAMQESVGIIRKDVPELFDSISLGVKSSVGGMMGTVGQTKDSEVVARLKEQENSIQASKIAMTDFALTAEKVKVPTETYMGWLEKSSEALRWFGFSAFQSNEFLAKFGKQIYQGEFALEDLIGGFQNLFGVISPEKFAVMGELIDRNTELLKSEDVRKKVQEIGGTNMGAMMQSLPEIMEIVRQRGEQALPEHFKPMYESALKEFGGNKDLMERTVKEVQGLLYNAPTKMMGLIGGQGQNYAEMSMIQDFLKKQFPEWYPGKTVGENILGGKAFEQMVMAGESIKGGAVTLEKATEVYKAAMEAAAKEFSTIAENVSKGILEVKDLAISGNVSMGNVSITNAVIKQQSGLSGLGGIH